jgi:hypothetical protein
MNITLTQSTFDRIMRAVAKVEGVKVTGAASVINGTNTLAIHIPAQEVTRAAGAKKGEWFWAELTGEATGLYSWKKLVPVDGVLVDSDPLIEDETHSAAEINGKEGIANGTKVQMWHAGAASGSPRYLFVVGGGADGLFPVLVTKTGGSAGDRDNQCSFIYTVKDLDNNVLVTGAAPVWARPAKGKMIEATRGLAYVKGDFVLFQVDEVPDLGQCPDEEE